MGFSSAAIWGHSCSSPTPTPPQQEGQAVRMGGFVAIVSVLTGFRTMGNAHIAALLREVTTLVAGEQEGQQLCQPEKDCDWGKYIPG